MSRTFSDTWLLLRLRWQLAWNGFRSRKTSVKVLTVLGLLWVAAVAIGISSAVGVGAGLILRRLPAEHLDSIIPGAILTAASLIVLLGSFGAALGSLFLASDLDTLMTAPVDRKAVFTSKILDGIGYYYALLLVTALPALVFYGLGVGYGPLYYVLMLLTLAGTPLLPAGLAAILVMLVARFAPASRVREVLGLLGALFGLSCAFLGQTSRLWMRDVTAVSGGPEQWLVALRGFADLPVPSIVAGRGLSAAGAGDFAGAVVGLAGFLLLTFGFFVCCVLLADNLYAAGWVRMQSSGSARRSTKAENRPGLLSRATAAMAIALKDWRVIPRDLRNFAQMLAPLLLLPIIYINLLGDRQASSINDLLGSEGVDPTGPLVAAGVLLSAAFVFGRIADTSISREGKSWWLMKAAPLSNVEIMRGKYLAAVVPYLILSTLLMAGAEVWKGFSLAGILYGWYGVEILGAGMIAIQTGLSVPWARLDWDDPRRMSSGWGGVITLVVWVLLAIGAGLPLTFPLLAQVFDPSLELWATVGGLMISTAVCAAAGLGALAFGANRLSMVGES